VRFYNPDSDREDLISFAMDTAASARIYLAHGSWMLGEVGRAQSLVEQAIVLAVDSAHAPTLVNTYFFKAVFEIFSGDAGAARRTAELLVELSSHHQLELYMISGPLCLTCARAHLGDAVNGAAELRQALAAYTTEGYNLWVPFFRGQLAAIEAEQEGPESALTQVGGALALGLQTGEHWTDAFLHRIRGEILFKRNSADTAPAEEAFLTAIAVAKQQKARSFELRAAMSLARLWRFQGKVQEARELLAAIYGWFTEGFNTRDLKEAKVLLEELAA
jgi:predicted ATPase